MKSFLNKIFSGENDQEVHNELIKLGKGEFKERYLIEAKKQKGRWSIKTSSEFANFLVKKCLEKINGDISIKGIIVSTFDIRRDMGGYVFSPEEQVKQFMGIKQLKVDGNISVKRVLEVMDKYPKAFYALSFSSDNFELKIKAKAPKSAKPSSKGENTARADFCSLKTSDKEIINDLIFDFPDFNEIAINHTIVINEVILPKGIEDPVKVRELAQKKGKIIRKIVIDGKSERKEKEFLV